MSKLVSILLGAGGTAIIAGGGGYLLLTQNTKTIQEKFKKAIIDFTKDNDLVTSKLTKLSKGEISSNNQKLKSAQEKSKTKIEDGRKDFEEACKEIYKSTFSDRKTSIFKDFQTYCSWNIKDKVTEGKWATVGAIWASRFEKLKVPKNGPLSKELTDISKMTTKGETELEKWCTQIAEQVFEGDAEVTYKNASLFCGKEELTQ